MRLFVTGATGFIGSRLLPALLDAGHDVHALVREGGPPPSGATVHRGDLLEPGAWSAALDGCDAVVHLAAATGRAKPAEHFRVNLEGTRRLTEACRRAERRPILFVSSIAVAFEDHRGYPYAQSKAAAERVVRDSGLPHLIVRPTIVLGRGSPVFEGLWRLAGLPVLPVFGPGRARVQPIHVDDLVRELTALLAENRFDGRVLTLGGPEVVTMEELLRRLRRLHGRSDGPVVHVPLSLLLPVLRALERVAYGALPVTVGQLASFRFDGLAEGGSGAQRRERMRGVAEALALSRG